MLDRKNSTESATISTARFEESGSMLVRTTRLAGANDTAGETRIESGCAAVTNVLGVTATIIITIGRTFIRHFIVITPGRSAPRLISLPATATNGPLAKQHAMGVGSPRQRCSPAHDRIDGVKHRPSRRCPRSRRLCFAARNSRRKVSLPRHFPRQFLQCRREYLLPWLASRR